MKAPEGQAALFVARVHGEAVVGFDAAPPPEPDPIRMARSTDTAASHEAARDQVASGRATTHGEAVERALRRRPWSTSLELFCLDDELRKALAGDRAEVNRRLDSLLKAGRVVRMRLESNSTLRPCTQSHLRSRLIRWALTPDAPRAAMALAAPEIDVPVIDRGAGTPEPLTGDRAA